VGALVGASELVDATVGLAEGDDVGSIVGARMEEELALNVGLIAGVGAGPVALCIVGETVGGPPAGTLAGGVEVGCTVELLAGAALGDAADALVGDGEEVLGDKDSNKGGKAVGTVVVGNMVGTAVGEFVGETLVGGKVSPSRVGG